MREFTNTREQSVGSKPETCNLPFLRDHPFVCTPLLAPSPCLVALVTFNHPTGSAQCLIPFQRATHHLCVLPAPITSLTNTPPASPHAGRCTHEGLSSTCSRFCRHTNPLSVSRQDKSPCSIRPTLCNQVVLGIWLQEMCIVSVCKWAFR